jgi:hypothetical protein
MHKVKLSANDDLVLGGHDSNSVSCYNDRYFPSSTTSKIHPLATAHDDSFFTFLDKIEDIDFLDMFERRNTDADESTNFLQSLNTDHLSVSSFSRHHKFFSQEVNADCRFLPPRSSQSQDDCLNSKIHPELFNLYYQQPWCIRYYKFQLGLINTREVVA